MTCDTFYIRLLELQIAGNKKVLFTNNKEIADLENDNIK